MDPLFRVETAGARLRHLAEAAIVVLAAFAAGIALSLGGLVVLADLGITRSTDFALVFLTTAILQFVGFYLVVLWFFRQIRSVGELVHAGRPGLRDVGWTVAGLAGLVIVLRGLEAVLVRLGTEPAANQVVDVGRSDPVIFLYLIPVTVLFVAPAEELVFRGVVQGSLRRAYGVLPGIVLGAAVFGAVHVVALGPHGSRIATVLVIAALGLVLGTVYELAGTIAVPIAVHALWNVLAFLVNYVEATGGLA